MNNVITVDGPSGVGKGTLAVRLAQKLHWHLLDSGAIYRALALYASECEVDLENERAVAKVAKTLPLTFKERKGRVIIELDDLDVTGLVRLEATGNLASIVAKHPKVREALLERQRQFLQAPGLIADGRDMGTEIFPNAPLKLFLTASSEVRAERRYKQLLDSGVCVKIDQVLSEVEARDERDRSRVASPLIPAEDAIIIDTSQLDADEVFALAWKSVEDKRLR